MSCSLIESDLYICTYLFNFNQALQEKSEDPCSLGSGGSYGRSVGIVFQVDRLLKALSLLKIEV